MMLDPDAFLTTFPGEDEHVELKQGLSPARAQETAVAFSNTDGGVLIVGVSPDGRPVGISLPGERAATVSTKHALAAVNGPPSSS